MQMKPENESTDVSNRTQSKRCSGNTYVHIWKLMAPKTVGHVAIEVGSCKPGDPHGEYISIHPGMIPAIGPTTVLPLPAKLANHLTEDMAMEAASQKADLSADDLPTSLSHPVTSLPPDYTFQIPNLNTDAMRAVINRTREEVVTGQTTYQLLPKVKATRFFFELPQYLNYNPVDIIPSRQLSSMHFYGQHNYNCATLVKDILQVGGLPLNETNTPWGSTPNDVAMQISKRMS